MGGTAGDYEKETRVEVDDNLADAIGAHHSFESAVADLIDNSLDAGANEIRVQFVEDKHSIVRFLVIDNGKGMNAASVDSAMVFAKTRDYESGDLGHFGVGLKAASLSQARVLRVYSKAYGASPVGREISDNDRTLVRTLKSSVVDQFWKEHVPQLTNSSGTVVEWKEPKNFLNSINANEHARALNARIESLRRYLGLTFHKIISRDKIQIIIEVVDQQSFESGIPRPVEPQNPFEYRALDGDSFPYKGTIKIDELESAVEVHLWPPQQAPIESFRLLGNPGGMCQGFFFYWKDRLMQAGGWNTLREGREDWEFVRIAIDLKEPVSKHVKINPEKSGIQLDADLAHALEKAELGPGRMQLEQLLELAKERRKVSKQRTRQPVVIVKPSRGFGRPITSAFVESVEQHENGPVSIRWRILKKNSSLIGDIDDVFQIDLESRVILLNARYRDVITGQLHSENSNDAPLFKTLLLLKLSQYFEGTILGAKDKKEIIAWQQLLKAAIQEEIHQTQQRLEGKEHDLD